MNGVRSYVVEHSCEHSCEHSVVVCCGTHGQVETWIKSAAAKSVDSWHAVVSCHLHVVLCCWHDCSSTCSFSPLSPHFHRRVRRPCARWCTSDEIHHTVTSIALGGLLGTIAWNDACVWFDLVVRGVSTSAVCCRRERKEEGKKKEKKRKKSGGSLFFFSFTFFYEIVHIEHVQYINFIHVIRIT